MEKSEKNQRRLGHKDKKEIKKTVTSLVQKYRIEDRPTLKRRRSVDRIDHDDDQREWRWSSGAAERRAERVPAHIHHARWNGRCQRHELGQLHGRHRARVRRGPRVPGRLLVRLPTHIHAGRVRQRARRVRGLGQQAHAHRHQHIHRQPGRVRHHALRAGRAVYSSLYVQRYVFLFNIL